MRVLRTPDGSLDDSVPAERQLTFGDLLTRRTDGSVLVFLAHNALDVDKVAQGLGLSVYDAIAQFHAAETAA